MRKYLFVLLAFSILMLALVGCGDSSDKLTHADENNLIAGITDDELVDDALTILLCGPRAYEMESIVSLYEEKYGVDVNVIKYADDNEWNKFATKLLSQDSDFDLFMPVEAQLGSVIRNGLYQDLSAYEDVSSRIESNSLTNMISSVEGGLIGVPCYTQTFSSTNSSGADTLFKYCYKNVNLYMGVNSDTEGEELFEVLKHHYGHPDDEKENAFYDFEYNEALTSYVFMNKFSQKKEQAAEFLCFLFDVFNNDIESTVYLLYPLIEDGSEYVPSWLYYTYEFVEPIANAFEATLESDGSDEALRKLAQEAIRGMRMRLEG